jgi:S1-C subfamily serine protease
VGVLAEVRLLGDDQLEQVNEDRAIIITNAHVVAGSTSQTVTPVGLNKKLPARIIGISHDVAIYQRSQVKCCRDRS